MRTCLTLTESSETALAAKIAQYGERTPLVEVRLDYFTDPRPPRLPDVPCRFLATCRPIREGGRFEGPEEDRLGLLSACARNGFQLVDLEWDVQAPPNLPPETQVVRSLHSLKPGGTAQLDALFKRLEPGPQFIRKLAVQIEDTPQLTRLLSWMEGLPRGDRFIIVGMGDYGQPSRFIGELLGNEWTYVSEEGSPAAPGQFSLEMAGEIEPAPGCWIYGLLGDPVEHSISYLVHNRLFRMHGLDKVYFPLRLNDLKSWFQYVAGSRLDFGGFSVTLPFKVEILDFLSRIDSPVQSINTLVRGDGGWRGENTDLEGFLSPLRKRLPTEGLRALVLGNGGAARTAVHALKGEGVEVLVVGRSQVRLAHFAREMDCRWQLMSEALPAADLLVNTTPVGQYPDADRSPVLAEQLDFRLVYDLVYNPPRTRLLKEAAARGCLTISGLEMFVEQAALQFETWAQITADRDLVRQTVESQLW